MADYVRLAEAPCWVIQYPTCSACNVDLETEDGDWTCPVCGTSWPSSASDGDVGTLYEDWSGESLGDAPTLDDDQAMDAGIAHERAERKASFARWGWCEHGMPSSCAYQTCPGGAAARSPEPRDSNAPGSRVSGPGPSA